MLTTPAGPAASDRSPSAATNRFEFIRRFGRMPTGQEERDFDREYREETLAIRRAQLEEDRDLQRHAEVLQRAAEAEARRQADHRELLGRLDDAHRITAPPGSTLLRWTEFVFSPKLAGHLSQGLLDMRTEYFEALAAGRTRKAKWVRVRGCLGFFNAVALQCGFSVLSQVKRIATGG